MDEAHLESWKASDNGRLREGRIKPLIGDAVAVENDAVAILKIKALRLSCGYDSDEGGQGEDAGENVEVHEAAGLNRFATDCNGILGLKPSDEFNRVPL